MRKILLIFIFSCLSVASCFSQYSLSFSLNDPSCNGVSDGSINMEVSGDTIPYTVSWFQGLVPLGTSEDLLNLAAGEYRVIITDTATSVTDTITLTDPAVLSTTSTFSNPSCTRSCDGSITTLPTGGTGSYLYSWNSNPIQATPTATNLCADTFIVTITDLNNCIISDTIELIDPSPLSTTTTFNNSSCFESCNGNAATVALGGIGPYTYWWSTSPLQTTDSVSGLCAGEVYVIITDSNACTLSDTVTLSDPALLSTTSTFNNTSCYAVCDGDATTTPSGGIGTYTYLWSTSPIQITPTASLLCADTFYVSVSDSNSCSVVDTIIISEPTQLSSTLTGTNPLCKEDSSGYISAVLVGGTAPYAYSWNSSPVQTTPTAVGLYADTFYVSITDTNGCSLIDTLALTDPLILNTSTTTTNPLCFGSCDGTATTTPVGGTAPYSYLWNSSPAQSSPTASSLCADTFFVVVTDTNGCTVNDTIQLQDPSPLSTSSTSTDPLCNGSCDGTALTTPSGGTGSYTYLWNNAALDTTAAASDFCPGITIVTVSDSNNCSINDTIVFSDTTAITTIDTIINAQCYNDYGLIKITPTNTLISYTGTLYTEVFDPFLQLTVIDSSLTSTRYTNGSDTTQLIWSALKGSYILVIKENSGAGCEITLNIQILEPSTPLSLTKNFEDNKCKQDSIGWITVNVKGGTQPYSYSWSTGKTTSGISGLVSGYYGLTIRDANNCSISETTFISDPFQDLILIYDSGAVSCRDNHDGYVQILDIENGLPPYTYLWSDGTNDDRIVDLDSGFYSLMVTDGNNCSVSDTFRVDLLDEDCIVIYNVITPDENGKNDVWEIKNIQLYPNCDVAIFNRWGEEVFSSKAGYNNTWGGMYNGELLNSGDYYYVVNLNTGAYPPYTGPIKILK